MPERVHLFCKDAAEVAYHRRISRLPGEEDEIKSIMGVVVSEGFSAVQCIIEDAATRTPEWSEEAGVVLVTTKHVSVVAREYRYAVTVDLRTVRHMCTYVYEPPEQYS